jgi:phage gp36-like protein
MPYASKQEMIDRFGQDELIQLTDRSNPPTGAIVDSVLDAALADADAEINGYLQARYTLPLASVPLLVSRLARDIARYFLYDDQVPETIGDRYRAAVKTLDQISKGVIQLGLDQAGQSTPATASPETVADTPVFSTDTLADYQ